MNFELKKIAGKSLHNMTNDDTIIYGTHQVRLEDGESISFSYNDLIPLQIAEKNMDEQTFSFILKSCDGLVKNDLIPELSNYKNTERLKVYIKETERNYVVISFGEYQPTLYRIYIEGIFEKKPSNLSL
jgi:hypothetical protein